MIRTRLSLLPLLLILLALPWVDASAQVPTGVPQFGSFQDGSIDTVNLATLNVHFEIPIRKTPGRGLPFSAILNTRKTRIILLYMSSGAVGAGH